MEAVVSARSLLAALALLCFVLAALVVIMGGPRAKWAGALVPAGLALWLLSTGAVSVSIH